MEPVRSIGVIMDGNRRWAKERGLSVFEGHAAGFEALKRLAEAAPRFKKAYGLEYVTFYAFSTENWNRSSEEVGFLMGLFENGLRSVSDPVTEKGERDSENAIRIRVIGDRSRFSPGIQKLIQESEDKTAHRKGVTAVFALSYGGRSEIVQAAEKLRGSSVPITEESFASALWTANIPDPDLIIRTSGEERLSNFLPWQSVYSELFFTKTLWPDFSVREMEAIIEEYRTRTRRYGA